MNAPRTDYRCSAMDGIIAGGATNRPSVRPTCKLCIKLAALAFDISEESVLSKSRELWIVHPRWAAMWLAHRITGQSLAKIGKPFDTDHSTVRHAVLTAEELRKSDGWFRLKTDELIELFRAEY